MYVLNHVRTLTHTSVQVQQLVQRI